MDDGNGVNEEIRAAEKLLSDRRLNLKERFLREEISADEYDKLNKDVEAELEKLERKREQGFCRAGQGV